MINSIFSKNEKADEQVKQIDNAILDVVVTIAKNDDSNILFLFSAHSYNDYSDSRDVLSNYIDANMKNYKQRLNGCDTTSSTIFNTIESDFKVAIQESKMFDRLILSVFTKNRAELDDLAIKCLALDNVNVYIL